MGSLDSSCILTPGRPDPQKWVGQKSKILDFAQNDFGGISDDFPEIYFLWVKFFFSKDLENFSNFFFTKNASEIDF